MTPARGSPEAVKQLLEECGWKLSKTYSVYQHGPLTIQEVSTRSQPRLVAHYARALADGLEGMESAKSDAHALSAMRDSILVEFDGRYDRHGRWSRSFGPFGNIVGITEQTPLGVLYIRHRSTMESLRHKDKARAIEQAEAKLAELQRETRKDAG